MFVEIQVKALNEVIKVLVCDNKLFLNDKKTNVDAYAFIEELFLIIASWENNYVNLRVKDGESYHIRITQGNDKTEYFGKNKFPKNYNKFKKLINSIK